MLTVVENHPEAQINRLRVARAHLQAAVAHINNEAQRRVPVPYDDGRDVEGLRLIVRALADIIEALESSASQ